MRYFIILSLSVFVTACSHFKAVPLSLAPDNSSAESMDESGYFKKAVLRSSSAQDIKPVVVRMSAEQSEAPAVKQATTEKKTSDQDFPNQTRSATITDNISTSEPNKPQVLPTKTIDTDLFLDGFLNLKNLDANKQTLTDFSDYGFITPTDTLETQVNDELKLLREDLESTQAASATNLLTRLPDHFQLDLNLDNRRISSQLNWFVNNPDYLDRTFKRSARYIHYIAQEVEKRGLPMELALLPFVESAYDPFAYSHGRASGLWQFIPGTGRIYGLHQNWWYDGRRDILASTKAALDYLSYLNKRFDGNWLHALASYNSGSGRVSKAIKNNIKKSKATDFWSLKLPKETEAYVPKLLAMAKIVADPERYGVSLPPIADTPYFSVVNIDGQLDLAQAATLAETDINEIYKLNPGFNQWATAPLGPHRILVPVDKKALFEANLAKLPQETRLTWNRYSVKRGDSLIRIAHRFNTTPKLIKQVNRLRSDMIREQQKLLIPIASKGKNYYDLSQQNRLSSKQSTIKGSAGSSKIIHTVKPGDTVWDLARKHKVGVRSLAKWNGMAPTDVLKPGKKLLIWSKVKQQTASLINTPLQPDREMIKRIGYRVKKGDSLARIANKFSVSVKDLIAWNKLNRNKYLQPGQKLTIFVDLTNT